MIGTFPSMDRVNLGQVCCVFSILMVAVISLFDVLPRRAPSSTSASHSLRSQRRLPATSQRHTRLMQSERSRVYSGQFSGAGNIFVAACQDERICVYRVPDWKLHKTIVARDVNWTVTSVDITPDEGFIAYSSITPVIHLVSQRHSDS